MTYLYAVYLDTLQDLYKFPLFIDDVPADNDPRKMFLGGLTLQRPGLLLLGDVLYAGFGGLCDAFNVCQQFRANGYGDSADLIYVGCSTQAPS